MFAFGSVLPRLQSEMILLFGIGHPIAGDIQLAALSFSNILDGQSTQVLTRW